MKNTFCLLISLIVFGAAAFGQGMGCFADSIRKEYGIPELGYAVVSADSVLELAVSGVKKVHTNRAVSIDDRFRGSNTKGVTGFIAAELVRAGKIGWDTRFFDLFPELRAQSKAAYGEITLLQLLSFRAPLIPYTYTNSRPVKGQFKGTESEQRYQFMAWAFRQPAAQGKDGLYFSNLGYVAAGLMLEKASGKTYKGLVAGLGQQLGINFGFGAPNSGDNLQPWGHDARLQPELPGDNYKLAWLQAAGNLNISLPDYAKFIQVQLKGLAGKSTLLSREEFSFLHYGLPTFAVGWFWQKDEAGNIYSYNTGNPRTFLTKVYVFKDVERAYILFANVQSDRAEEGMDILYEALRERYDR